jgi:uncharacterized protein (DUF885 family)
MSSLLMFGICTCCLTLGADDTAMDKAFDDLGRRYVQKFPELAPVSATQLGDHRFDGRLDELTPAARTREAEFLKGVLAELTSIDRAKLSRAHQVDYALLRQSLTAQIWRLEKLQEWAWNPLIYTELAGSAVYGLMAREFAPLPQRLGHIADRLEQFPRLLEQVRATLEPKRVPPIHAETAVKQNRGVLSILEIMVEPKLSVLSDSEQGRLKKAMATARSAIEAHQSWLEKELDRKSVV